MSCCERVEESVRCLDGIERPPYGRTASATAEEGKPQSQSQSYGQGVGQLGSGRTREGLAQIQSCRHLEAASGRVFFPLAVVGVS
jgi:hypothetical protein